MRETVIGFMTVPKFTGRNKE